MTVLEGAEPRPVDRTPRRRHRGPQPPTSSSTTSTWTVHPYVFRSAIGRRRVGPRVPGSTNPQQAPTSPCGHYPRPMDIGRTDRASSSTRLGGARRRPRAGERRRGAGDRARRVDGKDPALRADRSRVTLTLSTASDADAQHTHPPRASQKRHRDHRPAGRTAGLIAVLAFFTAGDGPSDQRPRWKPAGDRLDQRYRGLDAVHSRVPWGTSSAGDGPADDPTSLDETNRPADSTQCRLSTIRALSLPARLRASSDRRSTRSPRTSSEARRRVSVDVCNPRSMQARGGWQRGSSSSSGADAPRTGTRALASRRERAPGARRRVLAGCLLRGPDQRPAFGE